MNKTFENLLKAPIKEKSDKKNIELRFSVADSVNILLCFIMARCTVFSNIMPFGVAAYAAVFVSDKWFLYLASSILGLFQSEPSLNSLPYLCAMLVATAFMGFLKSSSKIRYRALIMSMCLFSSLVCKNIITEFYTFEFFTSILESVICFCAVYVFHTAIPVLLNANERHYLSDTEAISTIAVFAMIIRCLSEIPLIFNINLSVTITIVFLLITNLEGELVSGAAIGIVFGIICGGNSENIAASTGAFAIASLCSGLLKHFGKLGVILGFFIADAAMTAFFKAEILPFDAFEVMIAAIIFLVTPKKIIKYISSFSAKTVHSTSDTVLTENKFQKVMYKRLKSLGDSFFELSHSYTKCFENQSMSQQYIIHMLDTASAKICPECGLKYSCWERGYKTSYAAMSDMLKKAEQKGALSESDIPEPFSSKCKKINDFTQSFNQMFEIYRVEKMWQKRLNDARILVSEQLRCSGSAILNLAEDFNMCLDVPAEKHLKTELDKAGIKADDVTVMRGHGNDFSIDVYLETNRINKKDEQKIKDIICDITDTKVCATNTFYTNSGIAVTYKPACEYTISTGFASACRNAEETCGDSCTIYQNLFGETVVAISDGMGTGAKAAKESTIATELLKKFSDAGMNVETSLELINSSLLLSSSGENFTTLDVCTARSSDGVITFSKNGAAPSYLKNEYGISKINSKRLPFGINDCDKNMNTEIFTIDDSAVILMMSDGISDVFVSEQDDSLIKLFENTETSNPQILSSLILNEAIKLSGGKANDDMTVAAISIWKN